MESRPATLVTQPTDQVILEAVTKPTSASATPQASVRKITDPLLPYTGKPISLDMLQEQSDVDEERDRHDLLSQLM